LFKDKRNDANKMAKDKKKTYFIPGTTILINQIDVVMTYSNDIPLILFFNKFLFIIVQIPYQI
jgi:hypothetical protein